MYIVNDDLNDFDFLETFPLLAPFNEEQWKMLVNNTWEVIEQKFSNPKEETLTHDEINFIMKNTFAKVQILDPVRGNNILCTGRIAQDWNKGKKGSNTGSAFLARD